MTYSTGNTILDDDYNIFATGNAAGSGDNSVANINTLWGTGTGSFGLGQTDTVAAVSAGSTISATQWATLLTRMTSLGNHTGVSITGISNPSAGDTIGAFGALSTNITNLFGNGRLGAHGSGADSSVASTSTSGWNTSSTLSKTITFADANKLRYFFNAGGLIRCAWSRSGGTTSDQNTAWTNLLSNAGTIVLSGSATNKTIASVAYTGITKIGGGGSPSTLTTTTGAFDLTATPTTLFAQSSTTYGSNKIEVKFSISGNVITIFSDLSDDYTPPDPGSPDNVDGTLTQTTTIRLPSTTYLADTWSTVSQNSPSWTQS